MESGIDFIDLCSLNRAKSENTGILLCLCSSKPVRPQFFLLLLPNAFVKKSIRLQCYEARAALSEANSSPLLRTVRAIFTNILAVIPSALSTIICG